VEAREYVPAQLYFLGHLVQRLSNDERSRRVELDVTLMATAGLFRPRLAIHNLKDPPHPSPILFCGHEERPKSGDLKTRLHVAGGVEVVRDVPLGDAVHVREGIGKWAVGEVELVE
jgi:hypothetical protein